MVKTVHEWTDYSSAGVATQKQRIAGRFRQRLSRELKALKENDEYLHADDDTRQELEAALRSHISQDRLAALVEVDVIVTRHQNPVDFVTAVTANMGITSPVTPALPPPTPQANRTRVRHHITRRREPYRDCLRARRSEGGIEPQIRRTARPGDPVTYPLSLPHLDPPLTADEIAIITATGIVARINEYPDLYTMVESKRASNRAATPAAVPDPSLTSLSFSTAVEATRAANDALHFTIEEQSLAESFDLERAADDDNEPDDWDKYYAQVEAASKKARVKRYNGALDREKAALIEANYHRLYKNGQGALAERSWAEIKRRGGISQVNLAADFPDFANTVFKEGDDVVAYSSSDDEADNEDYESIESEDDAFIDPDGVEERKDGEGDVTMADG